MGRIRQGDICAVPVYLLKGRKCQEQAVITWLWVYAMTGEDWSLRSLGEAAGCSVTREMLDKLTAEGVVVEVAETDRASKKMCDQFYVESRFVPDRPVEAAEGTAKARTFPAWVFDACAAWKAAQGFVGPLRMHRALTPAVAQYGAERVVDGLGRYARGSEARFNPTPEKFVQNISRWIKSETSAGPGAANFADLLDREEANRG